MFSWLVIPAFLKALPNWVWYVIIALAAALALYSYGYSRGKFVEKERCEQAARAAQKAADAQDLQAEREGRAQDEQITQTLQNQKKVDDARIEQLQKELANRKPTAECLYDDTNSDPDDPAGGVPNNRR
jgi:type II secretory pathway pseudopilin PulG